MSNKPTKPVELEIGETCSLDGHWDMGHGAYNVGKLTYNAADTLYEVEAILDDNPINDEPLMDLGGASYGGLVSGEQVTLIKPFDLGTTTRYPGTATARRAAGTVIIGCRVRDRDEAVFDSLNVFVSDLELWLGLRPFDGDARKDGLRIRDPEDVRVDISTPAGSLETGWFINTSHEDTRRVLEVRSHLEFTSTARMSVGTALSFSYRLRHALSLLTGNDSDVRRVVGILKQSPVNTPVNILYGDHRAEHRRARFSNEMLFTRGLLGGDFARILNNCFATYEKFRSAFDLLDVAKRPDQVVEFKFLTAVIALEAFDRCRTDQKFVADAVFEPIRDSLVAAIPSSCPLDLRQALKQRLKFGNERSLGYRLRHLIKSLPGPVQQQLTGGRSANDFVEEVKNARNYLVHWPLDRPAHNALGLVALAGRLRAWLQLALLCEVGLAPELVMERMMKHPSWRHILTRPGSSGSRNG